MRDRVQVQGPQGSQPLQTVARPGAASAGAPRVGQSRGELLARSLASIEPEIAGHLDQAQAEYEEKETTRAYDALQGMTFDEAKKLVDSGQLRETENPWYEAAFQKQYGIAYAGKRKRDILKAYETQFDKHNGDLEGFIASHVQRDASLYGENKFVSSGIREGMGDFLGNLRNQHAEFKMGVIKATTVDQFRGAAGTVIDNAVSAGEDPSAAVRNLYEQHRQQFGLTYQQMDDNILALAKEYAAVGDVSTVEALLTTDIKGSDGTNIGSFTSRARYSEDANTILNLARKTRGDLDRTNNTSEVVGLRTRAQQGSLTDEDKAALDALKANRSISQEMHESLLVQNSNAKRGALSASFDALQESSYRSQAMNMLLSGRGFGVTDFTYTDMNGKVKTIKRDEIINGLVTDTLGTMAEEGYSEGEMAATLSNWGVGSTYQVWENALSDGYLSLGQAIFKAGPDGEVQLPPAALAAYGTWRNLGEYPHVRARHVKDQTALRLYRDAEALERGGMEPETALITAARIDRRANRASLSKQIDRQAFGDAVSKVTNGGWWDGELDNGGWASQTIERTARILVDAGLPMERAVEQSVRMFEESHTIINGVAINSRNKLVPPNFGDMADVILEEFAEKHGEDVRDLTLVPSLNGEQTWLIARKETLMPHEDWVNGGSFNITEIQQRAEAERERQAIDARERANKSVEASKQQRKTQKEADTSIRQFNTLSRAHRRNVLDVDPGSPKWEALQRRFGKDIYPDGGYPTIRPPRPSGD